MFTMMSGWAQNNATVSANCGASVLTISVNLATSNGNRINMLIYKDNGIVGSASDIPGPSFSSNVALSGSGSYYALVREVNNDANSVTSPTVSVNCSSTPPPPPPPTGGNNATLSVNCGSSQLTISGNLTTSNGNRINILLYKDNGIVGAINDIPGPSFTQSTPLSGSGSYYALVREVNNDANGVTTAALSVNCSTNPPPPPPPTGSCSVGNPASAFDYADCNGVGGWALDQSNLNQPVTIDIYVDGTKTYAGITANGDRQDLVGAFGGNSSARYHGFSYQFPADAPWKNGQNHTISIRICGVNNEINGGPKTVSGCGGSPRTAINAVGARVLYDGDPNLNLDWDWYAPQYTINYLTNTQPGSVNSVVAINPFDNAAQNDPRISIVKQYDKYRQDGWMLVARDFGLSDTEAQNIGKPRTALTRPFFALYNKYTGKLRLFIFNPPGSVDYSHHAVTISLANNLDTPALLAFEDDDSTKLFIDQYRHDLTKTVLTSASENTWSVAEFNLAYYDPRIFNTNQFDDCALVFSVDNVNVANTTGNGDLAFDGGIEPKSYGKFVDGSKTVSDFFVKTFKDLPDIIDTQTGTFKKLSIGGVTSGLDFVSAASDFVNGLFGGSGGYDINLSGKFTINAITETHTGGYSTSIYLKRHSPRKIESTYEPLQDIPWGVVGFNQLPTVQVYEHFQLPNDVCLTTERGYFQTTYCNNIYTANGIQILPIMRPVVPPLVANDNGLTLTEVKATYFIPNSTTTPLAFDYYDAKQQPYSDGPLSPPRPRSAFENHQFSVIQTNIPFSKIGIYLAFQPVSPTIYQSGTIPIYKVFSTKTFTTVGGRRGVAEEENKILPYPNPFHESINIPITSLAIGQNFEVQILSIEGKIIWSTKGVVDNTSSVTWNGKDLNGQDIPPGMYLSKLICNSGKIITNKIVLSK